MATCRIIKTTLWLIAFIPFSNPPWLLSEKWYKNKNIVSQYGAPLIRYVINILNIDYFQRFYLHTFQLFMYAAVLNYGEFINFKRTCNTDIEDFVSLIQKKTRTYTQNNWSQITMEMDLLLKTEWKQNKNKQQEKLSGKLVLHIVCWLEKNIYKSETCFKLSVVFSLQVYTL